MKKGIVSNAKEIFIRYKKKVRIAVGLVLSVVGFVLFLNVFQQPVPNEQFALCEQVAQNIAMNLPSNITSGTLWIDVTDDFSVHVIFKNDSVEVTPSDEYFCRPDTAIVKFNDGALVPERRDGVDVAILTSVLVGLLCFIAGLLLVNKIYEILNADVTETTSE